MNENHKTGHLSDEPDARERAPPDQTDDTEFDIQGNPWQEIKSASLRSDEIAIAKVIAMSWIR